MTTPTPTGGRIIGTDCACTARAANGRIAHEMGCYRGYVDSLLYGDTFSVVPKFATGGVVPGPSSRPLTVDAIRRMFDLAADDPITPDEPSPIADNPHKPGTHDWREWETTNVRNRQRPGTAAYTAAKAVADQRLATLKETCQHASNERTEAVEAILAEVRDATRRPNPPAQSPPGPTGIFGSPKISFNGIDISGFVKSVQLTASQIADEDRRFIRAMFTLPSPASTVSFSSIIGGTT
jgi:hypothetical protein